MNKAQREFTPEFKQEAVALLSSSGRPLTQIAGELGIQPSMLRSWRRRQNGEAPQPQPAPAGCLACRGTPDQPRPGRAADVGAWNPGDRGGRVRPATTSSCHALPVASNLLDRQFRVVRPNTVWLADMTYLPPGEGWLYLAAVLDLATRKVVGWSMRQHMRADLTCAALAMAIQRQRPPPGLLQHADRGSQCAADDHRKLLSAAGMRQSISRRGNCLGNAPMGSFFHTLKVELVQQRQWATQDKARRDVFSYIKGCYNRQRIHCALATRRQSRWSTMPPDPCPSNQGKIRCPAPETIREPMNPVAPVTNTRMSKPHFFRRPVSAAFLHC
jgi:transposase InsO family protein